MVKMIHIYDDGTRLSLSGKPLERHLEECDAVSVSAFVHGVKISRKKWKNEKALFYLATSSKASSCKFS